MCVTRHLVSLEVYTDTWESTRETNRTNVTCVARHLVSLDIYAVTWESTQETNHTSVHNVTKVSANPAACSDTNVMYTATEDHISVLTVECCLSQTMNWSVMFVFTLVQSHNHVHSNRRPHQCPYCGMLFKSNDELKRHVRIHTGAKPHSCTHCSDRFTRLDQLKSHLLKSHNEGTWLTCHICQKKFSRSGDLKEHLRRHGGVKPYVCSDCPKRFYTADERRYHQPVHSDFKQFCCGKCGKDFKRKRYVKRHFERCSESLGFIF